MKITKESDLVLILKMTDKRDEILRAKDCLSLKIRVFTDDDRYALVYSKADVDQGAEFDKLFIDRDDLEKLESGVVCYTYEYNTYNDREYTKSKKVVTDFYFANDNIDFDHPENIVNFKTIERLKEAIDKVAENCEINCEELRRYVQEEYTNKLQEEIRRSTDVDIRFFELIKELQDKAAESGTDITDLNSVIEDIKKQLEEHDVHFNSVEEKLTALKSRTEAVDKDLDFRLDNAEARLNVLQDSNPATPGSVANAIRQSQRYADELLKDVSGNFVSEKEYNEFKNSLTPHPTKISAFQNDMGYINDVQIFNRFYTREETDNKLDVIADQVQDIENSYVRADQVTVIKDEEGNLIREMVISSEPEYYTKEEADDLHNSLKNEYEESFERVDSSIAEAVKNHKEDIEEIKGVIDNDRRQHDSDVERIDEAISDIQKKFGEDISTLESKHTEDIESVNGRLTETKEELSNKIDNLDSSVTENYYTKPEIDDKEGKLNSDISSLREDMQNSDSSLSERIDELEANHNSDFDSLNSSLNSTKEGIENSLKELEEEVSNKFDNIDSSIVENYYTKPEIDSKENVLDGRISVLEAIDHNLYAVKEEVNSKFSDIDSSLNELNEKADEIRNDLTGVDNRVKVLEGIDHTQYLEKEAFESSFIELTGELDALENNINGVDNRVKVLEGIDHNLYMEKEAFDSSFAELTGELNALENKHQNDISTMDNRVKVLEAIDHNLYAAKEEVNSKFSNVDSSLNEISNDLTGVDNRVKVLEGIDHNLYLEKETFNSSFIELTGELNALENNINGVDNRVKVLEAIDHNLYLEKETFNSSYTEIKDEIAGQKSELESKIKEVEQSVSEIDLSPYLTIADASSTYQPIGDYALKSELYDDSEIDNRIKVLEAIDHTQYLTEHQSLDAYATKEYVDSAVEAVDVSDQLTEYIKTEDVEKKLSEIRSEIPTEYVKPDDISSFATVSYVDSKFDSIEEYDDSELKSRLSVLESKPFDRYLTEHQSLEAYATKEYVQTELTAYQVKGDYALKSDITDMCKIWRGTRDQYDSLGTYDNKTIYCING